MNLMKKMTGCLLLAAVMAVMAGCVTTGSQRGFTDVDAFPKTTPTSDKFNVGDLVIVTFSGTDALLAPHEERIKDDGTITLPLIGAIAASGKSPGDLQKEIWTKYIDGNYYRRSLNVTVRGQERSFFVNGEVRSSGRYPWTEGMTVLKAISSAGDFTDFANRKRVTVTRLDGRMSTVNCEKAMDQPELDLPVYPGDRVYVRKRIL